MIQHNSHNISRFKWNTSFDDKNLANDLQKNLSFITNYKLSSTIEKVFANACPKHQIWKIDTLEIDLGEIMYSDINTDLPFKLKRELRNALNRLVTYASLEDMSMEVVALNTSKNQLIIDIFKKGYLPANTSITIEKISDVISFSNGNNCISLEQLVLQLCSKSISRKRLALQLDFKNLKHIVTISEPNHVTSIIAFAQELFKINKKYKLFSKDTLKFESNLWVFIFNYLFQDKRILFNRSAFVESCITQCLQHYNINLKALKSKIKKSNWNGQVISIDFNLMIDNDIGFTRVDAIASIAAKEQLKRNSILREIPELDLDTSYDENSSALENAQKVPTNKENIDNHTISIYEEQSRLKNEEILKDYWFALEQILKNKKLDDFDLKKSDLNDLFKNLSKYYPQRFAKLFTDNTSSKKHINAILDNVTLATLKSICTALTYHQKDAILGILEIVTLKSINNKFIKNDTFIYKQAVLYLTKIKGAVTYNTSKLLAHTIKEIAKSKRKDDITILKHFLTVPIERLHVEHRDLITVQNSIKDLFDKSISNQKSDYIEIEVFKLLEDLFQIINEDNYQTSKRVHLQNTLIRWMELYPNQTLVAFKKFKDKTLFFRLLPHIANHYSMDIFLLNCNKELHITLYRIKKQFIYQNNVFSLNEIVILEDVLLKNAMQIAIENTTSNHKNTIISLLHKFCNEVPQYLKSKIINKMKNLIYQSNYLFENFELKANELSDIFKDASQDYSLETIIKHVKSKSINKIELSKLLKVFFNDSKNNHESILVKKNRDILLNYLIKGATQVLDVYQQKYSDYFRKTKTKNELLDIKYTIESIFWKCAIDYASQAQNNKEFIYVFETTLYHCFNWTTNKSIENIHATKFYKNKQRTLKLEDASEISLPKLFKIVETYFQNKTIKETESKYQFSELITIALESSPHRLKTILVKHQLSENQILKLQEYLGLDAFSKHMAKYLNKEGRDALISLNAMFYVVTNTEEKRIIKTLSKVYWEHALYIVKHHKYNFKSLKKLVVKTVNSLVDSLNYDMQYIIDIFQNNQLIISKHIKKELLAISSSFSVLNNFQKQDKPINIVDSYYKNKMLPELCYELCVRNKVPIWLSTQQRASISKLVSEILEYYPLEFYKTLKYQSISEHNYTNLHRQLKFENLINTICNLNIGTRNKLDRVVGFYNALSSISIDGISNDQVQYIIFKATIEAWLKQNWTALEEGAIINEIVQKLGVKLNYSALSILRAFNEERLHFPITFQIAIEQAIENENKITLSTKKHDDDTLEDALVKVNKIEKVPKSGIKIMNAGIILINYYIPKLFTLLDLTHDGEFKSKECRQDAIHVLQYIVTGSSFTNELLMPLNKVLCGLDINEPTYKGILILDKHKDIIHDMINAIIGHWDSIEGSSIDGFRGNWLVRDGLLFEHQDSWELKVEKRAYDLLLNDSPFSFSIIKYAWMEKPLHVKWKF